MTASLAPALVFRGFDNNGNPLVGGLLNTYAAGTSTQQATYVDSTQTTQNTNPVVLNSRGECNLWLNPSLFYKFVLTDSAGNFISSQDQVPGSSGALGGTVPVNGIYLPSPNTLGFATNSTEWATLNSSGAWNLGPPSAPTTVTLTVNGAANAFLQTNLASAVTGQSFGTITRAGTTSADSCEAWTSAGGAFFAQIFGNGEYLVAPPPLVPTNALAFSGQFNQVGYADAPQTIVTTNYTINSTNRGGSILVNANSVGLSINSNALTPLPVGMMVAIYTGSSTGCTLQVGSDPLIWLPSGATGTRSIAANSAVTVYKFETGGWYVYGIGLS